MKKKQTFYMTFGYDSIDFDLNEVGFSLDDIVICVSEEKEIQTSEGENIFLNDDNRCGIHACTSEGRFKWLPEEKKIEWEGEVDFLWLDSESKKTNYLLDEEDIAHIIRYGKVDCIVPYTAGEVIQGLKVENLFVNVELEDHLSVDVLYSVQSLKEIIIEQYDKDGNMF